MSVVSSVVLAQLGLSESGCDVPGGTVVVDGSGRPTGLLQEQAQNLLAPLRRPVPVDDVARAIARASDVYVRQGITSVVEAGVGGGWIGRTPGRGACLPASPRCRAVGCPGRTHGGLRRASDAARRPGQRD
ncbi:MAG: amidohydrolase family protein [Candidatus Nanopelagicales bacterium]